MAYSIRVVPSFGKVLGEVIKGKSDGYFLATQNVARYEAAVFSEPIMRLPKLLVEDGRIDAVFLAEFAVF